MVDMREGEKADSAISEVATGLSMGSCRKSTVLHNLRWKCFKSRIAVSKHFWRSRNREQNANNAVMMEKVLKQAKSSDKHSRAS